ncbi:Ger(x)C family spore germination protein [Paenibacillus sp. LHD-117]|uniref:Ger(x)C family spore germination protein n=1 Tax=Paenibacillus sp. LHD-117 TaxID=3071412 RepID=UPI0027E1A433|nr:Ger(x)C family spore germination protein [Paenibacillus sp. LHD-117]MDQ6418652.1 Ger(x)C family spore germination protein [Paenibacillus sp. LHD-117]
MKNWRTVSISLLFLCCAATLTGCWSRNELNELSITSATAIDREGDEWVETFQVVIPSAISTGIGITGGGGGSPVIVYSTKGRTIREADLNSVFESPRRLYFAHNRIIVISEETARRGLNPILDVYLRNPDSRETVDVLVTAGKSRKILEQMMQIQKIPGDGIREINSVEAKYTSALPEVKMFQLAMSLSSDSASALLPEIYLSGTKDTSSVSDFENTSLPSKLKLGRVAVIKQDKMVGWLSRNEALGVAFIRNKVKKALVSPACPEEDGKSSTFEIVKSKTVLKPSLKNGKLHVKVHIKARGLLSQTDCKSMDLYKPEVIKRLEKDVGEDISLKVQSGWKSLQKLNTDAVGFADLAHRKYRKEWRAWQNNWDEVFADIQIQTDVHVTISNVGLSNQPINVDKLREGKK